MTLFNATVGKKYDFKRTNGGNNVLFDTPDEYYRGMPILEEYNGKPVFGSARNVGNIAAGEVAARSGLGWSVARLGLDALESIQQGSFSSESTRTQFGEKLGHRIDTQIYQKYELSRTPGNAHLRNIKISAAPLKRSKF